MRTEPLFIRFGFKELGHQALKERPMRTQAEIEHKINHLDAELKATRGNTPARLEKITRTAARAEALRWVLKRGYIP